MKLTARKTIVALGTAAALSLTGISAPAMAADDTNTTNTNTGDNANKDEANKEDSNDADTNNNAGDQNNSGTDNTSNDEKKGNEGNAAYALRFRKVESAVKQLQARIEELDTAIKTQANDAQGDRDSEAKLAEAKSLKSRAKNIGEDVQAELKLLPQAHEGDNKGAAYGTLAALDTDVRTANTLVDDAFKAVAQAKPFVCDSKTAEKNDDSGSSSFLDFGSLFSALGSSGETIVEKNGKKTCVSNVEYFSDKLKSIVSILTVVFTVITTVTKISETIQKQAMPKR